MIDQALRDWVDILDKETGQTLYERVPAYVYTLESVTPGDELQPNKLVEELRALLGARHGLPPIDFITMQFRWRGAVYGLDSAPMWRRKGGFDHHQVVVMKHVGGA